MKETFTQRPGLSTGRVYCLILLGAAALYWATAQTGPAWQDSGIHQLRVLQGQFTHPTLGLALAHPLYIALCRPLVAVFGPANLPWAMSLLSGLAMAVAVANVYLLGYWLTNRQAAAVAAAIALAVSHTAWWLATIAETYCLVAAGLTTELLLMVSLLHRPRGYKLALCALVSGLGFSLHNLALLAMPVYLVAALVLTVRRRLAWTALVLAAVVWFAGAAVQLTLIAREGFAGGDWPATIQSALFGQSYQDEVTTLSPRAAARAALYIGLNWPFLSLAPVMLGWWAMGKYAGKAAGLVLGAVTCLHVIFAVRYPVPDQFMFLLPSHVLLAVGAAVGLDRLWRLSRRPKQVWLTLVFASIALTPMLYGVTPLVLNRMNRSIRPGRHWPSRNENRYWITPWKAGESSAADFAAALDEVAEQAVIAAPTTAAAPLLVRQEASGVRPDVHVEAIDGTLDQDDLDRWADRPLYLLDGRIDSLCPALRSQVRAIPAGPLMRILFDDGLTERQSVD